MKLQSVDGVTYEVKALTGWQSHLYTGIMLDVLDALCLDVGIEPGNYDNIPRRLGDTYEYFVKFCMSTEADTGLFSDFDIASLTNIPSAYQEWFAIMGSGTFGDDWINAYVTLNQEHDTPDDQKKEPTGENI